MTLTQKRKFRSNVNKERIWLVMAAGDVSRAARMCAGLGSDCLVPTGDGWGVELDRAMRDLAARVGNVARLFGMSTDHLQSLLAGGVSRAESRRKEIVKQTLLSSQALTRIADQLAAGVYSLREINERLKHKTE